MYSPEQEHNSENSNPILTEGRNVEFDPFEGRILRSRDLKITQANILPYAVFHD